MNFIDPLKIILFGFVLLLFATFGYCTKLSTVLKEGNGSVEIVHGTGRRHFVLSARRTERYIISHELCEILRTDMNLKSNVSFHSEPDDKILPIPIAGDIEDDLVHSYSFEKREKDAICIFLKSAFREHPDRSFSSNQPYIFYPATNLFNVVFFAVPGDEMKWWTMRGVNGYPWNMVLGTHVFIAALFQSRLAGIDPLIVDVGLNMGQETIIVASLGGLTLSFEPLPKAWKTTLFNLRVNCLDSNRTKVLNYGIGSQSARIKVNENVFTPRSSNTASQNPSENVEIEIKTLDEQFFKQDQVFIKRPLLLKLDTEGHEYEALEGASKLLSDFPPYFLLIEILSINKKTVLDFSNKVLPFGYVNAFVLDTGDSHVSSDHSEVYFKKYWERPCWEEISGKKIDTKWNADVMDVVFEHKDATTMRLQDKNFLISP